MSFIRKIKLNSLGMYEYTPNELIFYKNISKYYVSTDKKIDIIYKYLKNIFTSKKIKYKWNDEKGKYYRNKWEEEFKIKEENNTLTHIDTYYKDILFKKSYENEIWWLDENNECVMVYDTGSYNIYQNIIHNASQRSYFNEVISDFFKNIGIIPIKQKYNNIEIYNYIDYERVKKYVSLGVLEEDNNEYN